MVSTSARLVAAVAMSAIFVSGCAERGSSATDDESGATTQARDQPISVNVGPAPSIRVEVADTPSERSKGLMHRGRLDPGTGMIFLFPSAREGAFWMFQTLVPLSIAWAADGRVVGISEMDPCPHSDAAACRRYPSPAAFDMAIEAAAGTFTNAGVRAGDEIRITGTLPTPSE